MIVRHFSPAARPLVPPDDGATRAGYVGCAQGIRAWCWQKLHPAEPLPPVVPSTKAAIEAELQAQLRDIQEAAGVELPKVRRRPQACQ